MIGRGLLRLKRSFRKWCMTIIADSKQTNSISKGTVAN